MKQEYKIEVYLEPDNEFQSPIYHWTLLMWSDNVNKWVNSGNGLGVTPEDAFCNGYDYYKHFEVLIDGMDKY